MHRYHKIGDFKKTRATGVGSSDIPVLAGLFRRRGQTTRQLWKVKTGREDGFRGNQATWWGRQLEGLVLKEWVERHVDKEVGMPFYLSYLRDRSHRQLKIKTEARHPEYPFALAHADLLVEDGEGWIQEAKSHRFFAARRKDDPDYGYDDEDFSQNGVPASEFLQVQWQLFCYGAPQGGVSTLIDTSDYREYGPVIADARIQEKCLALAERFWWHVEHDREPKPETWGDIADMFPEPRDTTAMVSGRDEYVVREMIGRKEMIAAQRKKLEAELEDLKNAVGLMLGENKYLTDAEGNVLARSQGGSREDLSVKKLRAEKPALYEELVEAGYITKRSWRFPRF